jgi:DNA-binding Lrp family transcriptional regulator
MKEQVNIRMPTKIDNVDKNLLNIIQAEFPLSREPFTALGLHLSVNCNEVIQRIERLKAGGIIRLIGPIFNPRRLGYRTTLVAVKVPVERLDEAEQIVSTHPMVSHCYERDHDFNLWFTLAMPVAEDIESEVHKLGSRIKAEEILNLPAIRTFKIEAYFNLGGSYASMPNMVAPNNRLSNIDSELSPTDRAVINELQQDLPLSEKPFDLISARLSMDVDKFLSRCQALLQCGIMRRFSASINHSKLGFTANTMACWRVPPDMVQAAGNKIAKFPEISHCYERQTSPLWPYNLFAMIHAASKETCRAITDRIRSETGLDENDLVLLFSTKEIKKTRVRYTV